jgi:hypothetical protein
MTRVPVQLIAPIKRAIALEAVSTSETSVSTRLHGTTSRKIAMFIFV